jgi:hypothetical protein
MVPDPACDNVPVAPPGDDVAVYSVIAAPPLFAGAVKDTFALPVPVVLAEPIVGASGASAVTVVPEEDADAGEVPEELIATTEKV